MKNKITLFCTATVIVVFQFFYVANDCLIADDKGGKKNGSTGLESTVEKSFAENNSQSTKPSKNTSIDITIPTFQQGFEIGGTALLLQFNASNLNYAILNKALPLQTPSWTEEELKIGYDPAFAVSMRYVFSGGADVNSDWTHLSSSADASVSADGMQYFVGPDYQIGPDAIPIRNASSTGTFSYDVINLDAGQFVNFGRAVQIRFFGGLSAGFLKEELSTTFTGNTFGLTHPITGMTYGYPGPFSMNQLVEANYTGVGPRLGFELDGNMGKGFRIACEGAASVLFGASYSKTGFTGSSEELKQRYGQETNYQFIKDENIDQITPGLEAKFGIDYKQLFSNKTMLTLEAGYQGNVYIDAINQYLPGSLVPTQGMETGSIFVETVNHTKSNFSAQGPYFRAAFKF